MPVGKPYISHFQFDLLNFEVNEVSEIFINFIVFVKLDASRQKY